MNTNLGYTIDLGTSPRGWFVAGIYRHDGSWVSDMEVAMDKTNGFQSLSGDQLRRMGI